MDMVVVLASMATGIAAAAIAQAAVYFIRPKGEDFYVYSAFAVGMVLSSQYYATLLGV